MMKCGTRVLTGILLTVISGLAFAAPMTLRQCVELALTNNPEMAASQARIAQAESAQAQVAAAALPRVTLSMAATRTDDPLAAFGLKLGQRSVDPVTDFTASNLNHPDAVNNLNTRFEISLPVYTGGQLAAQTEQARALARAARAGDVAARQLLIRQVAEAYQGIHSARAYIKVTGQSVKAAEETVRVVENLLKQGVAVKSDLLTARVHLEEARLRVDEATRREAGAMDRLNMLLGRPLGEPLEIAEPPATTLLTDSDSALAAQARAEHPGLRALQAQVDAARTQVDAARAGRKPQVSVMARQDWNDERIGLAASSYTVAGQLSWQAFDGGASRAGIARAQAGLAEAEARLGQAEAGVLLEVREARRLALEADARLVARESAVADAQEALRLTEIRYKNGVTTLLDVLAAQARLDKVLADQVAARHEREISRVELKRSAGVLSVETL